MFNADLKKSQEVERQFEQHIQSKYKCLTENSQHLGEFPYWDVRSTATSITNSGKVATYEVKWNDDYTTHPANKWKSGSFVVETGKIIDQVVHPSGISATNSDYYVIKFENDSNFYLIPTQKLQELTQSTKGQKYLVHTKTNYIIQVMDKDWFTSHCKVI